MFWRGEPVERKIALCAELGFQAAEFWGWSSKNTDTIAQAARKAGIRIATCCMEADKPLVDPGAKEALCAGLKKSIQAAKQLGVDRLILTVGNERKKEDREVTRHTVIRHLKALVPLLNEHRMLLCLEPLNPVVDHLGHWLATMSDAADICCEVDSPWVRILMDIYHQQVTEGNVIATIRQYAPLIGHFHAAGVPGRHELVGGELDYRTIFKAIDTTDYQGHIGLEFAPTGDPAAALREALQLV
jgi:hydroxypyruvate isomerase